jgi:hypothetical protein
MPTGYNPAANKSFGSYVTAHQMAALIALIALLFLLGIERGFRGLKIDIS